MGVFFFLVIVVGLCWVASDFGKKAREQQRELDTMRTEEEKQYRRRGSFYGIHADTAFKKKK